nr:reverse transcriptase domain-containing protein [Tanacetum cinerariifolium]
MDLFSPTSFLHHSSANSWQWISILLVVETPSTGSGNLYCQWELSPGSGNALCILFPTLSVIRNYNPKGERFLIASRFPTPSLASSPVIVDPLRIELPFLEDQFQEEPPPEVPMADNRTMAKLLQAPTEGYEDAIVIPEIAANNFGLSTFFPPSKTTNLCNEITRFQQRFDESFYEACDHFNDLLRACPHHGFSMLHQLDTLYNALNVNDHDSLNSAAGGNFLDKMPRECLKIIESKSKVCQLRAKAVVAKVNMSSSTLVISSEVAELKDMGNQPPAYQAPIPQTQRVSQTDFESYVKANDAILRNMQSQGQRSGTLPSNTITNPKEDLKGITTRSSVAYQGPTIPTPSKVAKQGTEVTKDQVQTPSSQISAPMPNLKSSIPYPSRRDNERRRDQANEQIEKFYEIFKDMSFEISFTDALILMPKFSSTLKALIGNKEKLSEMVRSPMNEHCSTVILKKLPRKLGDPGKFLIPCEFPGMDEYLALADLRASINLMPLPMWEALSLSELTPTCMTLELADRSVSKPIDIAKDVSFKVGVFHFPADFVVVDFEPDPRVPLILGRCFLKTGRALIDVHKANYNQITANKIDVIEMACEEYSQEVIGFSDITTSGNPTPYDDPIVSTSSPTLTPFRDSDFLLFEEADAFLGLEDDPNSPKINPFYYDPEGDILLLEAILNREPLPPLPNHEQYLPSFKKELKVCEAKTIKSSVDEPPEVELEDLPPYLEYAFLEGDNKLPVIIAKELGDEEKLALIKVMLKYGFTHRLSTAYHPQTCGKVKACQLPIELEHKAYWALKQANFDLAVAGDHRKVQLNKLNEIRNHAYENSLIYKEKTKRIHDSKIKNRVFNVGDQVLLFNSRLKIFSGKLKTRWSGSFTIAKVFQYGTVELSQANGPNINVNGHRVKHYFGGDIPQLDYPDCEVFRAFSFSFARASHPQLHFENPVSKSYRLTFSFGIPNKWP